MGNDHIQLEGTHEQISELLRAVDTAKVVLMQMGGHDGLLADANLERRISKLSYWSELLAAKVSQ
jgi:hypothetical protein